MLARQGAHALALWLKVTADVDSTSNTALTNANAIPNPAGATGSTVAAGWSGGPVAVNRFYPGALA